MSKPTPVNNPNQILAPTETQGFDSLGELALDMRWSWNHATDEVWRQLDANLWEITHNPGVVLQTVSSDQIKRLLGDPVFCKKVDDLVQTKRRAVETPAWFQKHHPQSRLTCVAYFSIAALW
jgi:starch phosphorylase